MPGSLDQKIADALGAELGSAVNVNLINTAELPSCFSVSQLAVAAVRFAAVELADLTGGREILIDQRLVSLWFDMTLRPVGWELPSAWDAIAGVYRTSDGWIRLHTNAPHHRDAVLETLSCPADKEAVASAVLEWRKSELEEAVVAQGGAAAAMHSLSQWAEHPQGRAVAKEPLIDWGITGASGPPVSINQLKVLDLTRVLAGPVATRFLAGFGAEILRIDPPWWNEPGVEPEVTLGKLRAGLDLSCTEDRQTFEALLGQADVLVHGYRPGALDGLGYDRERLHRLAPKMIDVSLCAYGWSGPWADRRGFDSLVQMSCGIADEGMRRSGSTSPVPLPVQALDHATGYLMAAAVLRAIRLRNKTGQISSARLSLARTASLLISEKTHDFRGEAIQESADDLEHDPELTSWGPAHRVRFPVQIDQLTPIWRYPAGPLRINPASWAG